MSSQGSASSISRVFAPNFLNVLKKQDLLQNLLDLHTVLSAVSQDPSDRPRGLHLIANQLSQAKVINHADKDIRLVAACCAVDVLRIYAPEAPYDDETLLRIFRVIVAQTKALSTSDVTKGFGSKILYILTSLSVVKSCVVLVVLAKNGVASAYELLIDFIETLVNSIQSDHPTEVGTHMGSIMQACIEEMDVIEQDVLDLILHPLLPANKADNPAAFCLCQSVLRRTAIHLDGFISKFINQQLMASDDAAVDDSVYALVFEIHKVAPILLLRILPNICIQLQVDNEVLRLKTVKLLGKLFSSPYAEYGVQYMKNFREFLARCNDVSAAIRAEMIQSCLLIVKKKPALREVVEEAVVKKLRDVDGDVRYSAAHSLLELAHEDVFLLKSTSYLEIMERVKDRKAEVKLLCLKGMARVYAKHACPLLPPLADALVDMSAAQAVLDRVGAFPAYVVNSWGYPDAATRLAILAILQESLLPVAAGAASSADASARRASALLCLFRSLGPSERAILGSILAFKSKVRIELEGFLESRSKTQSDKSAAAADELMYRAHALMQALVPGDKTSLILEKILAVKDKHIFRLLSKATDPAEAIESLAEAKEDMLTRLHSKSSLGEYFGSVFEYASLGIANAALVESLLSYGTACLREGGDSQDDADLAAELLLCLSKNASIVFKGNAAGISAWLATSLQSGDETSALQSVRVAKNAASSLALSKDASAAELCTQITNSGVKSHSHATSEAYAETVAALACAGVVEPAAAVITALCKEKRLSASNKRLSFDISFLASLIKHCPAVARKAANIDKVLDYVRREILTSASSVHVICAVIKLWTAVCFTLEKEREASSRSEGGTEASPSLVEITDLLFECILEAGASFAGVEVEDDADQMSVRDTSTSCVFFLLRLKSVGKSLNVKQWHNLGWSLIDANAATRKSLATELNSLIQTCVVHPRILALPCLLATDDHLCVAVENALAFAVKRLRRTHQSVCDRALESQDEAVRKTAEDSMPETILPYVLHLLSHHPEFPSSTVIDDEQDRRRMKAVMKSLNMVLTVLLDVTSGENLSYLFKQVNIISRYYTDRIDSGNLGLDFVTRLTRKLLNEKIRSAENLQAYPGDVVLPMDLYELCDEGDMGDWAATEKAVEQAYNQIGKGKGPVTKKRAGRVVPQSTKDQAAKRTAKPKSKRSPKPKLSAAASARSKEGASDASDSEHESAVPITRPSRSGRATKAVKYAEVDEDESEVERWDSAVASNRPSAHKRKVAEDDQENVFEFSGQKATPKKSKDGKASVSKESKMHSALREAENRHKM